MDTETKNEPQAPISEIVEDIAVTATYEIDSNKLFAAIRTQPENRQWSTFFQLTEQGLKIYKTWESKEDNHCSIYYLAKRVSEEVLEHTHTFYLRQEILLSPSLTNIFVTKKGNQFKFEFNYKECFSNIVIIVGDDSQATAIQESSFVIPTPKSKVITKNLTFGKILTIESSVEISRFIGSLKDIESNYNLNIGYSQNEEGLFCFRIDNDLYGEFELEYEDLENKYDTIPSVFLDNKKSDSNFYIGGFKQFKNLLSRLDKIVLDFITNNDGLVLNRLKDILPFSSGSEHLIVFDFTPKGNLIINFVESQLNLILTKTGKLFLRPTDGLLIQDFQEKVNIFFELKNKVIKEELLLLFLVGNVSFESFNKIVEFANLKKQEVDVAFFNLFEKASVIPNLQIKNGETWMDINTISLDSQNEDSIVLNTKLNHDEYNMLSRTEKRTVRYNGEERRLIVSISNFNGNTKLTLHI